MVFSWSASVASGRSRGGAGVAKLERSSGRISAGTGVGAAFSSRTGLEVFNAPRAQPIASAAGMEA